MSTFGAVRPAGVSLPVTVAELVTLTLDGQVTLSDVCCLPTANVHAATAGWLDALPGNTTVTFHVPQLEPLQGCR
jgi:hypothetical protein